MGHYIDRCCNKYIIINRKLQGEISLSKIQQGLKSAGNSQYPGTYAGLVSPGGSYNQ